MAAKKQTYEQAMKRLEEIVSRIDSNELDIDSLGVNLKEAQELIKFCRDKLYKADECIKKMLDNNVIRLRSNGFLKNKYQTRNGHSDKNRCPFPYS